MTMMREAEQVAGQRGQTEARCDLILVTWNKVEYTKPCIESILRCTAGPYRLIIVDNGSTDDTLSLLEAVRREHPDTVEIVKHRENLGWVRGVNAGLKRARAPFVCVLNNDLLVTPGWLDRMLAVAHARPEIGLVNPTYNARGEAFEELAGRAGAVTAGESSYIEVNECNGACLLIKREALEQLGGLDEVYGSGGMDDADYSRRAELAGFRCTRALQAYVYHWENVSCNSVPGYWTSVRQRSEAIFLERWGERAQVMLVLAGNGFEHALRLIRQGLSLGRVGVRVHIVGSAPAQMRLHDAPGRAAVGLVEHNNLKWDVRVRASQDGLARLQDAWVVCMAAARTRARRQKEASHRIQALIAPAPRMAAWLRQLRSVHQTPVYESFAACGAITQQVGWARAVARALW